jgi:ribosomal protein S18 acetylase RimI-like enzyme
MVYHTAVLLRDFTMQDYDSVLALWQAAGAGIQIRRSDSREEIEKKVRRDPDLFIVAEDEDRIIGAVMGGFDGRRGLVYHLATDPDRRRQGVAAALMAELEYRLRQKGCIKVYLLVTNDNAEAQEYYLSRGWEDMTKSVLIFGKQIA